jgi:hypothetical protein
MSRKPKPSNALKHGAFSEQTLLWGETQEEYEAFRAAVYAEWQPDGPAEENLVEGMLNLLWRCRRFGRHQQLEDRKKLEQIRLQNELSRYADKMRPLAGEFATATSKEDVEEILSRLEDEKYGIIVRTKWPLGEKDDPSKWGDKIAKGLGSWKVERREDADEFLAMNDPIGFALMLKPMDLIDAKIEQTTKRLVQLKAFKQTLRQLEPKQINPPVAKA